jgi:hypothetical protein
MGHAAQQAEQGGGALVQKLHQVVGLGTGRQDQQQNRDQQGRGQQATRR